MDARATSSRLSSVLEAAGFASSSLPPPFSASRGSEHALLKWLADNLSMDNFLHPDELALVDELSRSTGAGAFAGDDEDEDDAMGRDVLNASDQDGRGDGGGVGISMQAAWLEDDSIESLQAQLSELQEERTLMQAQVGEMQTLSSHVDGGLQGARAVQQTVYAQSAHVSVQLGADMAAVQELDRQLDQRLRGLKGALADVQQMVSQHASSWLIVAADRDMAAYLQQDKLMGEQLQRLRYLMHSTGRGASQKQMTDLQSAPQNPASYQDGLSWDFQLLNGCSSIADELYRLRFAYSLGEQQYVEAMASCAASKAMVEAAKLQLQQPQQYDHHYLAKLRSEVQALTMEKSRLQREHLPKLAFELGQLQDAFVLLGDYNLKLQQTERYLAHMSTLLDTLLGQRARHSMLDILRRDEIAILQGLNETVDGVDQLLRNVAQAAAFRSSVYNADSNRRAHQHPSPPGSVASLSQSRPPLGSQQDAYLALVQRTLAEDAPSVPFSRPTVDAMAADAPWMNSPPPLLLSNTVWPGNTPASGASHATASTSGFEFSAHPSHHSHLPRPTSVRQVTEQVEQLHRACAAAQDAVGAAVGLSGLQSHVEASAKTVQQLSGLLFPAHGQHSSSSSSSSGPKSGQEAGGGKLALVQGAAGRMLAPQNISNVNMPTMTHAPLAEALRQLKETNLSIQTSTNDLVKQYTYCTALADLHKTETAKEREVLRNFYLSPVKLELIVEDLSGRLEALQGLSEM